MVFMATGHSPVIFLQDNWLSVLVAIIIAVFGSGGLVALLRSRKEVSKILVDTAQGAVVVQSGVIDSLQEEIARLTGLISSQQGEINELRAHLAEVNSLRSNVRDLEQQNELLQIENNSLRSKVGYLEKRVKELENGSKEAHRQSQARRITEVDGPRS